jgi:DnaK suppressor protein
MAKQDYKTIVLDPKYVPKKSEEYMCPEQLAYFYQWLLAYKLEIQSESDEILNAVKMADKSDAAGVGDDSDNSTYEQEITKNLKLSERSNNMLQKIDFALQRLENGKYGYSVISGDEIGIKRLIASPVATMTIEEKEETEKRN